MDQPRTAGMLIGSDPARESIRAALLRLGYVPLILTHAIGGSASSVGRMAACDVLVVDELYGELVRAELLSIREMNRLVSPAIVLLRDVVAPERQASDLDFDGILQIPVAVEEAAARLDAIVHSHRARPRELLPALQQLGLVQRVMNSVTNGISIADASLPELPLIYVNPAFEKITGYTFNEACGRNCRFLQGPETQQPALTGLREAIRGQREFVSVLRNFRKDGTPFWNEFYLSPLRDEQGRLTHFVGIQNDVTLRIELGERLSFLAYHDSLTGLANRELLFERLQQAVRRASRNGTQAALLFFDLDNFKHVNDVFGHDAGDTLLGVISERLRKEVRESDTVGRLGGDEFVVLLPDLEDAREIPALIHRITKRIEEEITIREQVFCPSASVGWSLYPRDGHDSEALLKVADFAMYANKHEKQQADQERDSSASADQPAKGLQSQE